MEPIWISEARRHLGLKEGPGESNNPDVVQFWRDIKRGGIKDDATPWCAGFVGAMLERCRIESSRFESAQSYLDWGKPVEGPVYGCIAVFKRDGGGHVGFVVGQDSQGNLLILGGNQGNEVSIQAFPRCRVVGYRVPDSFMVDETMLALQIGSAPFSTSEA